MKNIVICSDGTGNEYGQNNTNVVESYALTIQSEKQIALYDPGVGTGGWEYDEGTGALHAKHDQATGAGLQKNVEDGYRFLMARFEEGDKVKPLWLQPRCIHSPLPRRDAPQVRSAQTHQ